MAKNTPHDYFRAAFVYLLNNNWEDGQKTFAAKVGFSQSTISEVKTGKADASLALQLKICDVFKYSYEELIKFGRFLLETGKPTEAPTSIPSEPQKPVNRNGVYQLVKDGHLTQEEIRRKKMHDHLKIILDSGDQDLVMAIESNLVSFRKTVELQKQVKTLGKDMAAMAAQIKDLKRK